MVLLGGWFSFRGEGKWSTSVFLKMSSGPKNWAASLKQEVIRCKYLSSWQRRRKSRDIGWVVSGSWCRTANVGDLTGDNQDRILWIFRFFHQDLSWPVWASFWRTNGRGLVPGPDSALHRWWSGKALRGHCWHHSIWLRVVILSCKCLAK